jgi:hypothetical protein
MQKIITIEKLLVAIAALATVSLADAQHGWPLGPTATDHTIGNTFGEFQDFGYGEYFHKGIDVRGNPYYRSSGTPHPDPSVAYVTVRGKVLFRHVDSGGTSSHTIIAGDDGVIYRYGHLIGVEGLWDANFVYRYENSIKVNPGQPIAYLVRFDKDFHHLHYDLNSSWSGSAVSGDWLNPMAYLPPPTPPNKRIVPNPDPDPPVIEDVYFLPNRASAGSPWGTPFAPVGTGGSGCTVVKGKVDILARARDRDDAGWSTVGAATLWVYDMRWRACPDATPDCGWQKTRPFDDAPLSWGEAGSSPAATYFSNHAFDAAGNGDSDSDYGKATWLYPIVTNVTPGSLGEAGSWDTTAIPDGGYTVSVELTDFAGNVSVARARVCVQNSTPCTTELMLRDALDDTGAIPYSGGNWWLSPDITANPGTPAEDHSITLGAANPIAVRVWNRGSCALAAGTTYTVCLGWSLPSGMVPHPPPPPGQIIACQTETVPAAGWDIGTSQETVINWTPNAATVPLGHHCLVAWVDSPQDVVQSSPAVTWDDNRAQQNITFTAAPASGGSPFSSSFWFHPDEGFEERLMVLRFRYSGVEPTLDDVLLHVTPGLLIDDVAGGEVIGGYEGEGPAEVGDDPPCGSLSLPWEAAAAAGCTRVVGGIDPAGTLRLEGLRAQAPVRLIVEVWPTSEAASGEFADIEVIELGRAQGADEPGPIGGLTLRFEH